MYKVFKTDGNHLRLLLLGGVVMLSLSCGRNLNKPVLLDEVPHTENTVETGGPEADNSRCFVCHFNFSMEEMATTHARANVSCENCHGASDAHCGDEDNITPPEIMYTKAKINPSCMACHSQSSIDNDNHQSLFGGESSGEETCTDCHGDHRLSHRTRVWDKDTGELIKDDKVRMMDDG
jgi:hypothetical protein